ncbi:MAG: DUF938 domain-containing protein [Gammaproteobacteria bacterium]|nr:DUF938 domain-containing protein [Gammaproteobacteria bacterium]
MKPFAESCAENQQPILEVLHIEFAAVRRVLEIGSGTGQHAVFFAEQLPHLIWQTSDVADYHSGIQAWIDDARLGNVRPPLPLDVTRDVWPDASFDCIGRVLAPGGRLCLYGPFNYGGAFTSASNARFDQWLKARDPDSGVRNFEDLDRLAGLAGMCLARDYAMPANNRILVWTKPQ